MGTFHLIAGLGNPGAAYAATRHNIGFEVADTLVRRWGTSWVVEQRFKSEVARAEHDPRVMVCRPRTFMNESGQAIGGLVQYFQVALAHLLVVVDDADLPFGEIRLRGSGSSGGHHGLESVEAHLGSRDYPRLRVGIGRRSPGERQLSAYVLDRFRADEREVLHQVLERVAEQIECWLRRGIQEAMAKFNGKSLKSKDSE